jgi:putative heme-binding domain-containing protein
VIVSILARSGSAAELLPLRKGDHVALIGNTLADRMQHDGWFETLIQARFPNHELVIRNLGLSGDELTIRLRSADFGTPDQWLTRVKADVVLAFFGYNESFGDLTAFRRDIEQFLAHTAGQKYNGREAPRVVLFSPIAHEDLKDRSLPDGSANNERLEKLTAVMAEVARGAGVTFVDLFRPSQALYLETEAPLSINGVHLNDLGNRRLAHVMDRALFAAEPAAEAPLRAQEAALERIRQAVLDKNFHWFNRYRTVDGYSMYGGRADLKFVNDQTNRVVMDRELEVLDVMTANRDRRIWSLAQGRDAAIDDSNTPPFIPVITNKPGAGPDGRHVFAGAEEAIARMKPGAGLEVSLFASEEQFPELAKPVQMSFDTRGRLWVAAWPTYPHWQPKEKVFDKLLILEDTDGDGRADRCKTFADGLHCPTGFEFARGGVLVAQAPDLMLLRDTDGDDQADVRIRVLSGLDSADTHHTSNSFRLGPGGDLFFQEGTFHHSQVETPYGPPVRLANAGVFRYEPRAQKFEVYISYPFANPHGHVFDRWGQDFVTDGTGNVNYFAAPFSGHVAFPDKHREYRPFFAQRTRPCAATEILSSRHFPEDWQGDYLVANVIGFQGIHRYRVTESGAGFSATEAEPIVYSTDPNFRPVDIEMGPDGALYFLEWQNPIIGHMQHNLRDPSRDRTHGRVYLVSHKDRPPLRAPAIAGQPIETLLELLKAPEDRVRYRAKIELGERDSSQVITAVGTWLGALDANDPEYEHHRLEALWVHQYHDVVDLDLLDRVLKSADGRARAAATRVLCYWRDRVPDALDRLKSLAADPHPRVRLEAVRAASFFPTAEAIEIALVTAEHPSDLFLDYCRSETMRTLDPYWRRAVADGRMIRFSSEAGARFFLRNLAVEDLLKLPRSRGVDLEIVLRQGVAEPSRRAALDRLATEGGRTPAGELIELLRSRFSAVGGSVLDESIAIELSNLFSEPDRADLSAQRGELEAFAQSGKSASLRALAFALLTTADASADPSWEMARSQPGRLRNLLEAIPMMSDPRFRSSLGQRVLALLEDTPESADVAKADIGVPGRYVRIELPGDERTLTIAEVEVFSEGKNVAREGRASQKNTAHGGAAPKAIDGITSAAYGDGGQTHTEERTKDPWWEVDLGSEQPIDAVAIHNRGDERLGRRLEGYSLVILDDGRNVVFRKDGQGAPVPRSQFEIRGAGGQGIVRRVAMRALVSIPGIEAASFTTLARLIRAGVDRASAIDAILRLPRSSWPTADAKPLLLALIESIKNRPVADRTSRESLAAMQLGDALASLLPAAEARPLRKELSSLGTRVLRLGTVLEQMRYDTERLVAAAGKEVEIDFENTDLMPHNFVLAEPGALEEVGLLAEATASEPGALARGYVPQSNRILVASKLVQPRESQRLRFQAPAKVGIYPYVCTYPGHWRRMYGAFYVVADLDEYLADPEAYLAKNPLPIADKLLDFTRPRKDWTFADLSGGLAELEKGRSFAAGRRLFETASCVSCHQMNGAGVQIGADLATLDPKKATAEHILRSLLDPSAEIEDKYRATVIGTADGQVTTGLVVEDRFDYVKLIENPLASAEPRTISKKEITERASSPVSIMPKGLLDRLSREEILDVVAYVLAKGDPKHDVFKHDHAAHGHR